MNVKFGGDMSHHHNMNANDLLIGFMAGAVLIVLGFIPGFFQGLIEGVRNFQDRFHSDLQIRPPYWTGYRTIQKPGWLAPLGAALIVLTAGAYVSNI